MLEKAVNILLRKLTYTTLGSYHVKSVLEDSIMLNVSCLFSLEVLFESLDFRLRRVLV